MSDTLRGLDDAEATSRGGGLDRVWALWNRRKWLGIVVFLLIVLVREYCSRGWSSVSAAR